MRFFETLLSGAALVAAAMAVQIDFQSLPKTLEAGKSYTIEYSPKDSTPTTFILRKGEAENLDTVGNIGVATGGTFEWTVPSDLADGNYAFEVQQAGADPNYSGLIPLTGGSGEESSSSTPSGYPTMTPSSSASSSAYATKTEETTTTAAPIVTAPSASGTGSMTLPGLNSTITTATLSSTGGSSTPTTGPNSPPAEQTGAAALFGSSPLALLVGAAAMVYLN